MLMRARLDDVLGRLTLAEIAMELGLLTEEDFRVAVPIQGLTDFHNLAASSEAFFRYANAYLYFGVRLLSFRVFGPLWPDELPRREAHDESMNRRLFSLVTPPPLVLTPPNAGETDPRIFDKFLARQSEARWQVALGFLDGFHPSTGRPSKIGVEEALARSYLQEPVQYEFSAARSLSGGRPTAAATFRADQRWNSGVGEVSHGVLPRTAKTAFPRSR